MSSLQHYVSHCRNREYMSGVERDKYRIKQTNEVFTPTYLVQEMLDDIEKEDPSMFLDLNRNILDNSCGDGQFLSEAVIRRMERTKCTLEEALQTIYGVELMQDNVIECRKRLAGPNPTKEILDIVNKNIVCHDALTWDYKNWAAPKKYKTNSLF